ncbi:hypothetical protein X797_009373 [Metarhizium robertsii]|uniref:Uncharacterized protein n=2 Tax=Metarhizium robertsii TaxID=568076 RepID=E9F3D1_METRA|nr:uncharacterized protein MAA_06780 [Metarhizium robertsii ARSEF 23]EFY97997.1 hypothetical protein MAA_06780 [Metarhizium robertsii ARSEF 23]EXU97464.1 hypothetical protein X797_009373 [Metarhizium robertsii]
MSFSVNPRVLSVLCLAVASVAGQWIVNGNTAEVGPNRDPVDECWIKNVDKALSPCTCTGGTIFPGCHSVQWGEPYGTVRDANCTCDPTSTVLSMEDVLGGDRGPEESVKASNRQDPNGRDQPEVVERCICDPPAGKRDDSTDKSAVPATNCWCPMEFLDAKECRADLDNSQLRHREVCKKFKQDKPEKLSDSLQRALPNCTVFSLTRACSFVIRD